MFQISFLNGGLADKSFKQKFLSIPFVVLEQNCLVTCVAWKILWMSHVCVGDLSHTNWRDMCPTIAMSAFIIKLYVLVRSLES